MHAQREGRCRAALRVVVTMLKSSSLSIVHADSMHADAHIVRQLACSTDNEQLRIGHACR